MKTKRIDEYICLDVEQIVVDEMKEILSQKIGDFYMEEDREYWTELQNAAKVILRNYTV